MKDQEQFFAFLKLKWNNPVFTFYEPSSDPGKGKYVFCVHTFVGFLKMYIYTSSGAQKYATEISMINQYADATTRLFYGNYASLTYIIFSELSCLDLCDIRKKLYFSSTSEVA